ncbi:MAG: DUF2135 domain-containing protein [Zoogloeaceae bacterium]|jgi:tetratricopeptide (TPR) repeat protein|nr:DUF2135 domain-containing protein [Zoogloeaceae bacterium]
MKKLAAGLIFTLFLSGALIAANDELPGAGADSGVGQNETPTEIEIAPPSPGVLPPPPVELRVSGAEKAIELRELAIEGEIFGVFAQTTVEMRFYNPNARVLEGELQFPLAEGQTVTGFALSMKDKKNKETMREAVPVPKNRGRQVFEAVVRQEIDPALLEVTQGQHFKLRVYPLPPGETRRVRVTYSERLPRVREGGAAYHLYRLPLAHALKPAQLSISLKTQGQKPPALAAPLSGLALDFQKAGQGWTAQAHMTGAAARVDQAIQIKIHANENPDESPVYFGEREGKTYFYAELPFPANSAATRELPNRLALFWDASLSGGKRQHAKEFAFLDAFFAQAGNVTVRLQKLRDVAEPPRDFVIRNGDWSALKSDLAATVYDGATRLSAMTFTDMADLNLLFSDGLDNYSAAPLNSLEADCELTRRIGASTMRCLPMQPLYAILSAPGDTARLKRLSEQGALIDLDLLDAQGALALLSQRRPRIVAVEGAGISDAVWSFSGRERVSVAGRVLNPALPARVVFAEEDGKTFAQTFPPFSPFEEGPGASGDPARFAGAPFLWAALMLERLEADYDLNRGAIRRLGKSFAFPTRETSLIVLDRVEDYVIHDIDPPAELKEDYDRLRARMRPARAVNEKMERVKAAWAARDAWWQNDFPKGKMPKTPKPRIQAAPGFETRASSDDFDEAPRPEMMPAPAAAPSALSRFAGVEDKSDVAQADSGSVIRLRPWSSNASYIARMKSLDDEKAYRVYLDERPDYENSVAFYLDVADQFERRGRRDLALRILSNLAEIDLENRQILRVLGYRLLAAGEAKTAALIFRRVLHLAEDEPQSWRDLALAHEAAGDYQAAVEHFHTVAERLFAREFPGIEVIALTEMNAAIARARAEGVEVDTRAIDPVFLRNRPLDLRVVLSWDSDNTDIDLHVIDPNGEEAFYGAPLSYQGGRVSPDNTTGYGPEEYSLKTAKPGKYRVEVKFYGHQQQVISEATTLQLDFFTRYARENTRKESITLRLKDAKERIFVGEFEVSAKGNSARRD